MLANTFKMEHSWNNRPSNSTVSVWLFWKHPYPTFFVPIIYGIQNEKNQWKTYLLLHQYHYSLYISFDTTRKCILIMAFVHHQFIMHGLLQDVYIILITLILIPLWYFILQRLIIQRCLIQLESKEIVAKYTCFYYCCLCK